MYSNISSGRCKSETPLCLNPTSLPGGLLALGSGRVMVDMVWIEGRNTVGGASCERERTWTPETGLAAEVHSDPRP